MRRLALCSLFWSLAATASPAPAASAAAVHERPTDSPSARTTVPAPLRIPPRVLEEVSPNYPLALRGSGNDGVLVADLLIDRSGAVKSIRIVESSHPHFEQAAIDVLPKWRFAPGTVDGEPVESWIRQPIRFALVPPPFSLLSSSLVQGVRPYATEVDEALPQAEGAPAVKLAVAAVYPRELLLADVRGSAQVEALIDPRGRVVEVRTMQATHPDFGAAAKAAMESWRFFPARRAGAPAWVSLQRQVEFDVSSRDMTLDASTQRVLKLLKRESVQIASLASLDALPAALYQPAPAYPSERSAAGVTDTVTVELIIDREGRAQLPKAIAYRDEALAWAAVTAVQRWRFEPPRRNGQPVDALARVPVEFIRSEQAPNDSPMEKLPAERPAR